MPAAARTISPRLTASSMAAPRNALGRPPRLIVTTCAPILTAWFTATATGAASKTFTSTMQRIGTSNASGADPAISPATRLTATLAVAVPCPGFASFADRGSVALPLPSSTFNACDRSNASASSSGWAATPVSGCAITIPAPRVTDHAAAAPMACSVQRMSLGGVAVDQQRVSIKVPSCTGRRKEARSGSE